MVITWDRKITDRIHAWGKPQYKFWYAAAVHLMNVYLVIWIILGVLGWLAWWVLPLVAFSAWILTLGTQAIIGRERPKFEQTTGYKMWWRTYALPSGHAAISAAVATVILFNVVNPIALVILGIVFVVFEVLIGLGRIVVGVHYLADVIAGFVLGIGFGVVYSLL